MLTDYSGNNVESLISIKNIDKINPQIIGAENGKVYNQDIRLEYKDNIGIKEIFVDKYGGFDFRVFDDFYDIDKYFGIDVTDTKVSPIILEHPRGTRKYKYYLDNILYGITENITYTFSGLIPGSKHTIKIEAIDENENVLAKVEKNIEMNYFSGIETGKTDNIFRVRLTNIDNKIKKYDYAIWSDENKDDSIKFYPESLISADNTLDIQFDRLKFDSYTNKNYVYRLHIFLRDENRNVISILPINILFGKSVLEQNPLDPYNLKDNGNYQIVVTDFAGNKEEYDIYIKK